MANSQTDSLYKAFSLFIEAFRPYVVSVLIKEAGDKWPAWYVDSLFPAQKETWNQGLKAGSFPESLIDYPQLKGFVLKYKDLLKADFGKDVNKLATWLETMTEVRNKVAHFASVSTDEQTEVFIHMKSIARSLKMVDLESELGNLQENKGSKIEPTIGKTAATPSGAAPWFLTVLPHLDIRQGRLDESVFAANLAEVALGNGREIYKNPGVFFSKTYLTMGLKSIAKTVIKGLNGKEDAENRVISLQTGFGGGKTHTLISLFHISKWGKNAVGSEFVKDLLDYTGVPEFETANIAVFTNTTNDPAQGRTITGTTIRTMWGELAWQLGGKEAFELIRKNDEDRTAPKGLFKKVLEKCKPALILVDELADYCVSASSQKVGDSNLSSQTISFMQELTEAVASTNHCVAVVTLPASPQEVGSTPEAHAILNSLQSRVSRIGADTQPVAEDEIYEVIRRRLFEDLGSENVRKEVVGKYMELYEKYSTELPSNCRTSDYKERLLKSYPFHPELIDVFRVRWASNHDFQRTRGVLRLLAAIVSDLWSRQQSLTGGNLFIHSGQVNFANLDAISGQLKRLYGNGYDAVISADIAGSASNAFKVDGNKPEYNQWHLTQSLATVILMNSFGSEGINKGISVPELKLNLLTPGGFNHNSINGSLDELESSAYYLYYAQTGGAGKRYWFNTKPNINILINKAKTDVTLPDIQGEILRRVKERTNNRIDVFNPIVDPSDDIPEQLKPTLVILSPKYVANPSEINGNTKPVIEKLATKKGNSERINRNTMLFLVCSELGIGRLHSDVRDYLACQKIAQEYNTQLEKDQREELKKRTDDASRQTDTSIVVAYSIIVKFSSKNGISRLLLTQFRESLDHQINQNVLQLLKEEEWLLESVGLGTLRNNNLLPSLENPIRAKDVYEAFIRFDDKPMITGIDAVSKSVQRYCLNGDFCIAAGDGKAFNKYFLGESIPFFDVQDPSYWLVDKSLKPKADPNPEPAQGGNPEKPYPPIPAPGEGNSIKDPGHGLESKAIRSLEISGKIPLEQYTQIFNSFIMPLAQNNIEIEIRIKGKSTSAKPLTESSPEYKVVKESAKQLGLNFTEEP
jgi:hypothetical protein